MRVFQLFLFFGSFLCSHVLYVAPNPVNIASVNTTSGRYIGFAPMVTAQYSISSSRSTSPEQISLSTDIDSMPLDRCIALLQETLPAYGNFSREISSAISTVQDGEKMLAAMTLVSFALITQEAEFSTRLGRLRVLYNSLASRSNTLSAWMQQEIFVRDRLAVFLNTLYQLHATEKNKIIEMTASLRDSIRTLSSVENKSTSEMNRIANTQIAMFSWGYNATQIIDSQTVKLDALAQNTRYRIDQIANADQELLKLAKTVKALAILFNDAQIGESADSILTRLGFVANQ